jgi:ATP-binding cassette subfamily C protein CydD
MLSPEATPDAPDRRPGPEDRQSLRWLLGLARSGRAAMGLAVLQGVAGALLLVAQAALLAEILQAVIMARRSPAALGRPFALLVGVILARAALSWGREAAGFAAGERVRGEVRRRLLARLAALGPAFTSRQSTGGLAAAVIEHVEALQGFYAHYLPQVALAVLVPAIVAAWVFPVSWAAAGLLLLAAPLIPLFMVLVGRGTESIAQRNFQALARLSAHFLDVLQGLATLKLLHRGRDQARVVARAADDYRRRTMQVLRVAFLSAAVLEFFSSMGIALVAVYLGLHYLGYLNFGAYGRALTLEQGFFILLLAPEFFLPLRELGTFYHARAEAVGAGKEIRRLLDRPGPPPRPGGHRLPVSRGMRVDLDGVRFAYDQGRRPVLEGISLHLAPGERVALVGASGAGKTTLLHLLMGFQTPQAGTIRAGGVDLEALDPGDWRRHVAWIGQNPVLFHGTLGANIRMGNPQASPAALAAAMCAARVEEFARRLPQGLDSPVGEKGVGLSRGQAQRVALARAFLKDAPLLLLDEPTTGLDTENEALVLEAMGTLMAGRTVLYATHRLENLPRAERIVVLEAGRIAAQGSYADLAAAGGAWARLTRAGGPAGAP